MNKKHKVNLHKFYALVQLLQDNLDDFENFEKATPRMKQLRADLSEFCELLNNECVNTFAVQKSTYFQDLSNKIDAMMRHNFNPEM